MGIPQRYSRDLAARCAQLIEVLYDGPVRGIRDPETGGSLSTTFLLSMALPVLVVSHQRAEAGERSTEYTAELRLTAEHLDWLDVSTWRYEFFADSDTPNLAQKELPKSVTDALRYAAPPLSLPLKRLLETLRHSLAHGQVAYLNAEGEHVPTEQAAQLAFVSKVFDGRSYIGFAALRLEEAAFHEFLLRWARKLSELLPAE